MTSGRVQSVALSLINIDRQNRQRRELKGIEELADSIREIGLINPIVIDKDYNLIAGERRFAAHKHLDYDQILCHFAEDLEPQELYLLELEENVRREDLTWQDHTNAVAKYHEIRQKSEKDWTQASTAKALNISPSHVAKHMQVKRAMNEGVEEVIQAPKFSVAANFAKRKEERARTSFLRDLKEPEEEKQTEQSPAETPPAPDRFANIIQADFKDWAQEVQIEPFNLIHCDFPYGVNAGDVKGQSAAKSLGGYADSKDIYFNLLETLVEYQERFIAPSAHLIFWFSMDYYHETIQFLREAEWSVNPFPLIWHKTDNTGILPDSNRGPRRIYETALFASRGDRYITKAVANAFGGPVPKGEDRIHMSEKPRQMLEHFLRMVVDESTRMLDPTCGSGNSVKISEKLGASWSLGLELNPDYVIDAKKNLGIEND